MSSNNLNLFQQVYYQSFAADLVGTLVGTEKHLQTAFEKSIKYAMKSTLNKYGWSLSWGPRVWKEKPDNHLSGPDQAWFGSFAPNVQYPDGTEIDTCVVAIAGTALFSKFDWKEEDLAITKVVDFDAWVKSWSPESIPPPRGVQNPPQGSSYASLGTCVGIYNILTNTAAGFDQNIVQYLQTLPTRCRVIFTGHSLGGALSPTIPMGLELAGLLKHIEDPLKSILTLPAAGASPGEQNLSDAYKKLFAPSGPGQYQTWNTDLFNKYDIVPQAWSIDSSSPSERTLNNIPTIYGQLQPVLAAYVEKLVAKEITRVQSSGIAYTPIQGTIFEGTPPSKAPSNIISFVKEVLKQHTKAYHDEIQIGKITSNLYKQLLTYEGVGRQNLIVAAQRFPIIRQANSSEDGGLGAGVDVYPYDDIFSQ